MFNISNYLEKFKNIGVSDKKLKEIVIDVIKEKINISLEIKDVELKEGEVVLKTSPAIKNAIYIKKTEILEKIRDRIDKKVFNIR